MKSDKPITAQAAQLTASTLGDPQLEVASSEIRAIQDEQGEATLAEAKSEVVISRIIAGKALPPIPNKAFSEAIDRAREAEEKARAAKAIAETFKAEALSIQAQWSDLVDSFLKLRGIIQMAEATLSNAQARTATLETLLARDLGEPLANEPPMLIAEALALNRLCIPVLEKAVAEKRRQFDEAEAGLRAFAKKNGIPDTVFVDEHSAGANQESPR